MEPRSKQITGIYQPNGGGRKAAFFILGFLACYKYLCALVQKLRFSAPLPGLGLASMKHVVRLNHPHTDRSWLLVLISSIWMTRYSSQAPIIISLSKVGYDCFLSK